ncbi:uncharacterized protein E0L32_006256 [Thyridium curvatum]|uniref:Uncharacterized protein n=1 Tax=Thyridium curvatum TaxID=1093900 RepID=A0A507B053_9PEZI|nr:uncharacterized protein E0L32_006256 [Thyridium curvatum]TPX13283.1 hypothetical protein E0L32_006256 [Thyridium curvatum]
MAGPPTLPDKSSSRAPSPSPQTPSPISLTDHHIQTRLALAAQAQRNLAVAAACAAEMASKSPQAFGDSRRSDENKTPVKDTPTTDTPKTTAAMATAAATGSAQGKGSVRNMIKMFESSGGSGKTPDRKVSALSLRGSAGTGSSKGGSGGAAQRNLPLRQMFNATTPTPESRVALSPLPPSSTESSASTVVYMGTPSPAAPTRQGPRALPEPPAKSQPSQPLTSPRPHFGVESPQDTNTNSSESGGSQNNTQKQDSPDQPPAATGRPPFRTRALKKLQRATAIRVARKVSPTTMDNPTPSLPRGSTRAPALSPPEERINSREEYSRMLEFGPSPAIKTPSPAPPPPARAQRQTSSSQAAGRRPQQQQRSSYFPHHTDPRHRRPVRADPNSTDPLAAVKARQISPCTTTSESYYAPRLPPPQQQRRHHHGPPETEIPAPPPRRSKDDAGGGGEDDLARLRYQKYLTSRPLGRCLDPPNEDEGRTIVRAVTAPVTVGGGGGSSERSEEDNPLPPPAPAPAPPPPAPTASMLFAEDPLLASLARASVGALSFTSRVSSSASSSSSSVYSTDYCLQTQRALPSPTPAPLRTQASASAFWDMVRLNLQPTPSDLSSRAASAAFSPAPPDPCHGPQHQQQQQQQGQRQRSGTEGNNDNNDKDKGKGKQRSVDDPAPQLYSSSAPPHPFQTTHHRAFHPQSLSSSSSSARRPSAATTSATATTATSRGRSGTTATTATTAASSYSSSSSTRHHHHHHPGSPFSSSSSDRRRGRGYASGNYVSNPGRAYSRSGSGSGGGGGGGGGSSRTRTGKAALLTRQMSSEEKLREVDSFFDESDGPPNGPAPGGAKWI